MIVGMIFNVIVAVPLVLMVIQFARTKGPAPRRAARPYEQRLADYHRTMAAGMPERARPVAAPLVPLTTAPGPEPAVRRPSAVAARPEPRTATSSIPVVLQLSR